jgi:hypothetical protein
MILTNNTLCTLLAGVSALQPLLLCLTATPGDSECAMFGEAPSTHQA